MKQSNPNEHRGRYAPTGLADDGVSVPDSVREWALAPDRGDDGPADTGALAEIARSQADLAAVVLLARAGVTEVSRMRQEERHYVERREARFLGFSLGDEFVPLSESRKVAEVWRVRK